VESERVFGALGGADMPVEQLREWALSASVVLAADGGADRLLEAGCEPRIVVGDLDSITPEARQNLADVRLDQDQDTTDCDKLLALAEALGHESITLGGVEGDLLDHVLGSLQSAIRSPLQVRLALRRGLGWVLKGSGQLSLQTRSGRRVSLVPLLPCGGVTASGVVWPLERAVLEPGGMTSVSNRSAADTVEVTLEAGALFVFLETDGAPIW
jgi:thiamine pyrophosphokinase